MLPAPPTAFLEGRNNKRQLSQTSIHHLLLKTRVDLLTFSQNSITTNSTNLSKTIFFLYPSFQYSNSDLPLLLSAKPGLGWKPRRSIIPEYRFQKIFQNLYAVSVIVASTSL
ncbi:hypothetical protein AMECASPLE_027522 [Ameca splendens]|uniref:Uncharacterized protein n=1 Tax=Ameca splendens TaxID=208324 RepID=A0ABV0Y5G7_9TELE